ncbi:MAG TPA: DUF4872 domain-containing protein [Pyrinomonadaceae bacterium]|nr:DUF4872 domain-containing protein [Pyrinomonadaceae bacterium]
MPDPKKHLAGKEPESAAVLNALNQLGSCSNDLCTEEMLFGLGGGLGMLYFLFDMHGGHPIVVGTTYHASEAKTPVFVMQMCEAWGATTELKHSTSRSAATKSLTKMLDDGYTPIVWVEYPKLPYLFLSGHPNMYYTIVVYEKDGNEFVVGDLGQSVARISVEELEEARHSHYATKFRSLTIKDAPAKPDVREVLTQRIRLMCSQMLEGLGITNFGLQAFKKWADMLTNTKNKKGWSNCFTDGPALHEAMCSVYEQIELRGFGGSAFRGMYADFLDQSAGVLKKPGLKKVAAQFREADASWHKVALAALPNSIPILKETRDVFDRRATLLQKPRTPKIDDELDSIRTRLKELRQSSAKQLALSPADKLELFSGIRARVLETEAIERAAFTDLNKLV